MERYDIPGLRISEVARRTGTTTSLLRAWESRHGILAPTRTEGGQRLYSERDVDCVRLVQKWVSEGWSVGGAVARLSATGDQTAAASEDGVEDDPARGGARTGTGGSRDVLDPLEHVDPEALRAAYQTVRAILRATAPVEVRDALVGVVERLGGTVGPAATQDANVIPVDLSCGEGPPLLPRAEPASVARMRLEAVLPSLVEDGLSVVRRLRLARTTAKHTV